MCFLQCILGLLKFLSRDFWMTFFVLFRKVWIVSAHRKYWLQTRFRILTATQTYSNMYALVPVFFSVFVQKFLWGFQSWSSWFTSATPATCPAWCSSTLDPKRFFFALLDSPLVFFCNLRSLSRVGCNSFRWLLATGVGAHPEAIWGTLEDELDRYLLVVHVLKHKNGIFAYVCGWKFSQASLEWIYFDCGYLMTFQLINLRKN